VDKFSQDLFVVSKHTNPLVMPLFDLFVPYPVRQQILQSLSAYDVAKVDMVLGKILDPKERKYYLNPIRDLVWDIDEVRALEAFGMRLLLIGNDASALQQRLQHPQHYIRKYGHSRKLQIRLVGSCPVIAQTAGVQDKLIKTSLFGAPSAYSIFEDTIQMRRIEAKVSHDGLSVDTIFMLSFGASTQATKRQGFWRHIAIVPDLTVDLRLYVPSFDDRQLGEIQFPYRETLRLSRCVLRKAWLLSFLADVICLCLDIQALSVACLTSSSVHAVGPYGRFWLQKQIDIQNI
jgi:hypothetical protein